MRAARKNHSDDRIEKLLAVPRYAEALEECDVRPRSQLITSRRAWRREFQKWQEGVQDMSDDEIEVPVSRRKTKLLPRSLKLLFGGKVTTPVDDVWAEKEAQQERRRKDPEYVKEAACMSALGSLGDDLSDSSSSDEEDDPLDKSYRP